MNGLNQAARNLTAATQKSVIKPIEQRTPRRKSQKKKVQTLKKRLRQAREWREKKYTGDHFLPEQIGKIVKSSELVRRPLGFGDDELDLDQVEPIVEP